MSPLSFSFLICCIFFMHVHTAKHSSSRTCELLHYATLLHLKFRIFQKVLRFICILMCGPNLQHATHVTATKCVGIHIQLLRFSAFSHILLHQRREKVMHQQNEGGNLNVKINIKRNLVELSLTAFHKACTLALSLLQAFYLLLDVQVKCQFVAFLKRKYQEQKTFHKYKLCEWGT